MTDARRQGNLGPIDVDQHNWLYTEPEGLRFVHETFNRDGVFVQTDQAVVPWHTIRLALAIHDGRKRPRQAAKRKASR